MRAFILGNGPSLEHVDLRLLEGDQSITFACNKIHKHPSFQAGWRPDVYVFGDNYGNPHFKEDLALHLTHGYPCWVKSDILEACCNEKMMPEERLWWIEYKQVIPYQNCMHRRDMRPPSSWHPPLICNYTGAVNAMVQVAVLHHDVTEVVLLGCDGGYKKGKTGNHFTDDYQSNWYGPPVVERINFELQEGHDIISGELASRGIPTVNCSPTSEFKQYETADLAAILDKQPAAREAA